MSDLARAIDFRHHGLLCRADPLCAEIFRVRHDELASAAALLRDAHELLAHGYVHVALPLVMTPFSAHRLRRRLVPASG